MRKYTEEEVKHYWHARCEACGWHGLTVDCAGFGALADTGDYDDGYCPQCGTVVQDNEVSYSLSLRLFWVWRKLTFWVWRKLRAERKADEAWARRMSHGCQGGYPLG